MSKSSAFLPILTLMSTLLPAGFAFAEGGGSGSHGGGYVACRDDSNRVISVELADVYEGRTRYGLKYEILNSIEKCPDIRKNFECPQRGLFGSFLQLQRLSTYGLPHRKVEERFWDLHRMIKMAKQIWNPLAPREEHVDFRVDDSIREEGSVKKTQDVEKEMLKSLSLPKNCTFVQAARFSDEKNELEIHDNQSFLGRFNDPESLIFERYLLLKNQLMTHELIYKIARERAGDVTSERTRYILALFYSDSRLGYPNAAEHPDLWDKKTEKRIQKELKRVLSDLWNGKPFTAPTPASRAVIP